MYIIRIHYEVYILIVVLNSKLNYKLYNITKKYYILFFWFIFLNILKNIYNILMMPIINNLLNRYL